MTNRSFFTCWYPRGDSKDLSFETSSVSPRAPTPRRSPSGYKRTGKAGSSLLIYLLAAVFFSGCASWSVREPSLPEIHIYDAPLGGSLELSPSLLRVAPGQKVSWTNHTTYDLQIIFDPPDSKGSLPSFINRFSSAQVRFEEAGTYSYTLIFSTPKAFGRVTGSIVVEPPNLKNSPLQKESPETSPPEETPDTKPDII